MPKKIRYSWFRVAAGFLRIFTVALDRIFQAMLGLMIAPQGLKIGPVGLQLPAGAKIGEKIL